MSDATTCSAVSATVGEQLAGSAPQCLAWVAMEQRGPWGPKAFTSSHLDPELGRALEAAAAAHQSRPALIRRPGRHADAHSHAFGDPRRLLVAFTHPEGTWLLDGVVESPGDVLALDWAALERGDVEGVRRSLPSLSPSATPQLLVCTNGTRDVCCAVKGRPVALGAAEKCPGQVWEVTHTSGHRFAPTSVLLPAGTLHGRLAVTSAVDVLHAAERGETVLTGSRGRSTWAAAAQVAEIAVREKIAELSLSALTVVHHRTVASDGWVTEIRHRDGRSWTVHTQATAADVHRPESCGKALKPLTFLTAVADETG